MVSTSAVAQTIPSVDPLPPSQPEAHPQLLPHQPLPVFLPQGRYPENFVLISQLEVCQEGGVKKGGTWRTERVPDQTHGGQ